MELGVRSRGGVGSCDIVRGIWVLFRISWSGSPTTAQRHSEISDFSRSIIVFVKPRTVGRSYRRQFNMGELRSLSNVLRSKKKDF